MVQTETCRPCGTHIFSENFESIGISYLYVAKKGVQKYKKYDIKFMLCTPWEISPICEDNEMENVEKSVLMQINEKKMQPFGLPDPVNNIMCGQIKTTIWI